MKQCPQCGLTLGEGESGLHPTPQCPNCGQSILSAESSPSGAMEASDPIRRYFHTLREVIFHPTEFFRKASTQQESVAGPLAFALITHWVSSALEFLWRSVLGRAFLEQFKGMFRMAGDVADVDHPGTSVFLNETRDQLVHWVWGAGSVIIDPFLTLFSILFTSFFVFLGARILVSPYSHDKLGGQLARPREITYESALRVVCYGLAPSIFAGIPVIGPVISTTLVVVVTVIGARETYRIGTGRAILVALFPRILFLGIIFLGLFFFAAFIFKLVTSVL